MSIYLRGVGGAPGIALGYATRRFPERARWQHAESDPQHALERFALAQEAAARKLRALADQLRGEQRADEADIFEAQVLLVDDPFFVEEVTRRVQSGLTALAPAILGAIAQMRDLLAALDDPYLRERAPDIEAAGRLVLTELYGDQRDLRDLPLGAIVLADDLSPSEVMALRGGPAAGFVTAEGGPTSHIVILARAFGIPAVVGLGAATLAVRDGAGLILDGGSSLVVVEADATERASYQRLVSGQAAAHMRRRTLRDEPGRLSDGHTLALLANIGSPDEAHAAIAHGAEGVGLFRTELLFLDRSAPPGEDEQYECYRATLDILAGRPLVARTLDVGGDKALSYLSLPGEPNPALGLRGIRLCMRQPELFRTQVRALLRAAVHGDLLIMLPMITTAADVAWGQSAIRDAAELLAREGASYRADVPVGIMIETPAAAVIADRLARDVAFFSIGSNDLAQYTMAVDRSSAELMARYPHTEPAVMHLIAQSVAAGARAGIPVSVCGELAAIPQIAALLAGMGARSLSMAPEAIPLVKEHLRDLSLAQARALARRALAE